MPKPMPDQLRLGLESGEPPLKIPAPGLSPEEDERFDRMVDNEGYNPEEARLEIVGSPAPQPANEPVADTRAETGQTTSAPDARAADAEFDRLDRMGMSTARMMRRKAGLE